MSPTNRWPKKMVRPFSGMPGSRSPAGIERIEQRIAHRADIAGVVESKSSST